MPLRLKSTESKKKAHDKPQVAGPNASAHPVDKKVRPYGGRELSKEAPESEGGQKPIDPQVTVQAPKASGRVFISYASRDAAVAQRLCAALKAAGLRWWIAPRDVRAGESYAAAIVQAINSCRMLVLILSKSAIESSHVLREVERASSKKRPVLVVRMDAAGLPPDLEYFLSANQWLDASHGPLEQILPALIASVRGRDPGKIARP